MKKTNLLITSLFLFFIFHIPVYAQKVTDRIDDGVIRLLAIGNSFSEDGIENYLHELAEAAGIKMIIGNMYIGGASLNTHVTNIREDKAAYNYRKIDVDGVKSTIDSMKISDVLTEEPWDFISLQQVSSLSGDYLSYQKSLPELYNYVLSKIEHADKVGFILHQTWAYQQDSKHKGFANYNNDQKTMFEAITETSEKVFKLVHFDYLVPAGTAIQNARASFLGDTFTRDGYHLELNYGRFTAACAWYEALLGKDVRRNNFVPISVSYIESEIAKNAAHEAVKNPFDVTILKNYQVLDKLEHFVH